MKILIVAKSNRGCFIGFTSDGDYTVISLNDSVDIELGNELSSSTWDDREGLFKEVRNLTKVSTVHICIENWQMNLQRAHELVSRLNTPTQIRWLNPWPARQGTWS